MISLIFKIKIIRRVYRSGLDGRVRQYGLVVWRLQAAS